MALTDHAGVDFPQGPSVEVRDHRTLFHLVRRTLPYLLAPVLALLVSLSAWATHNRAGEIVVCKLTEDPLDLRYEATILTYTKLSAPADRPELVLDWGDGSPLDTIPRNQVIDDASRDLRQNRYTAIHTYAGPGVFVLRMEDPNRNGGVLNVPNSIAQAFALVSTLVISPFSGNNCSARFLNSPIQNACIDQPWIHNPAAYDPDGDSLSFEPTICLGAGGLPIPGYAYPGPNYSIDPTTGTITWNAPGEQGEYNIAFVVREWRRVNGDWVEVGTVLRDMQITVIACSNRPPQLVDLPDTCVLAGTFLSLQVSATDPDPGQSVTIGALGQPFTLGTSPAVFDDPQPGNPGTGTFVWSTVCEHVRQQPYQVVFSAIDNDLPVPLLDYSTMSIRVVAPAPDDPVATPVGDAIALSWSASPCTNAVGYHIYRRSGIYGYDPDHCETGVPAYTGYSFLAEVAGVNNTSYTDQAGLIIGNQYCYMVIAVFADGAESLASEEFCALLDRQVPVLTHVSVGVTDVNAGVDTVRWSNAFDLDTVQRPGPYRFRLYRGTGFSAANTLIWTSGIHPFLDHPDTFFVDQGLDTEASAHVYRVELLGRADQPTVEVIGSSGPASSIFLTTDPNDEQITVQWTANTPWTNTLYEVYRVTGGVRTLLGTSTTTSFVDTGLVNGTTYCYVVRSSGAYSDPDIVSPLLNWSQEACAVPVDLTPPCAPTLALDNDCELPLNSLSWNNPNASCADDTFRYLVQYKDSIDGTYGVIAELIGAGTTFFTHVNGSSVAGCYRITAIDTLGNESVPSNEVCGDNCPVYELPNVFTPNGDDVNDLFGPFPYRGVRSIDLQVFNRWGQVVFTSSDPDIDWRGTYMGTDEFLADGVYYYLCTVQLARLDGMEVKQLNGVVHLLEGGVLPAGN